MPARMRLQVVRQHDPHGDSTRRQALELIAEALAERVLNAARSQLAEELGMSPEALDRGSAVTPPSIHDAYPAGPLRGL